MKNKDFFKKSSEIILKTIINGLNWIYTKNKNEISE